MKKLIQERRFSDVERSCFECHEKIEVGDRYVIVRGDFRDSDAYEHCTSCNNVYNGILAYTNISNFDDQFAMLGNVESFVHDMLSHTSLTDCAKAFNCFSNDLRKITKT